MKAQLQDHYERCSGPMHSYTMVLQGNVVLDGILLRDMPITCEVKSAINCRLGQATTLNCSAASHSALRSLIIARFGGMFFNRKFRMECIVQSR